MMESQIKSFNSKIKSLKTRTNHWILRLKSMDQGQINGIIFLDMKKAFDTIDDQILLSILQAYGIYATTRSNGSNRICLKESRFACLITVNLILKPFVVEYLMQVSNLGPLLFLIYINDLPHYLETTQSLIYLLMTQFYRGNVIYP